MRINPFHEPGQYCRYFPNPDESHFSCSCIPSILSGNMNAIHDMTMKIDMNTSVGSIQQAFTSVLPYLKLEFFRSIDKVSGRRRLRLPAEIARPGMEETELCFNPQMRVAELEAMLQRIGLPVQVFRRSGNVWIETSLTNDWTLAQQNQEGELLSN